jgi:hypothetical protein
VAFIADLFEAKPRNRVGEMVDVMFKGRGEAPLVLLQAKTSNPSRATDMELQTLVHWIRQFRHEPFVAPDADVVRRIVRAKQSGNEQNVIASAFVENERLVMWTCEPKRYEVPVGEIPALSTMKRDAVRNLKVSTGGSGIHWDSGDVDLSADSIRAFADPEVREQQEAQRRVELARYATAIRSLREERGLRQADIVGLTPRQVRRLEEGETIPHSSTLRKLAAAHEMAVDAYLKELARRSSSAKSKTTKPKRPLSKNSSPKRRSAVKKSA